MGDLWKYKAIAEIKARQEEARNKMKNKDNDYECRSCGTLIKDYVLLLIHINNGHEHEIRYLNKDETS